MSTLDDIINDVKISAREMGYKKNRLVWYKVQEQLTVMFSIQRSLYGSDAWSYRFGICLHDITTSSIISMSSCQITFQMDYMYQNQVIESQKIINLIERWETMYGNIQSLRKCAVQGNLSGQCTPMALRYLTSNLWENGVFQQ